MIILRDISLRRGAKLLLHDANVTVQPGQRLALIGANGCGKTTTMRMVAGLEEVTEGEIWIGDRMVN